MAIGQFRDVENGENSTLEDLEQPLVIKQEKIASYEDKYGSDEKSTEKSGSIWMVLLSTCVAVCGSFEFGSCVSVLVISMNIAFLVRAGCRLSVFLV